MSDRTKSILLLGESGVGKTHYGAQLLKRLWSDKCELRMDGAATNLEPFEAALESLSEGRAAGHTATSTYMDSEWPIADRDGGRIDLIWPDYGGEQVKAMSASRRIPMPWRQRIERAPAWLLLVRLQLINVDDDIFSKPISYLDGAGSASPVAEASESALSDQARLVELLQMLLYVRGKNHDLPVKTPKLMVLLSCWDEVASSAPPAQTLASRMPLFFDFVSSNWAQPMVLGLSALGRHLDPRNSDADFETQGPEKFGYVVMQDGSQSQDITLPIRILISEIAK